VSTTTAPTETALTQLQRLEAESIHIFRETAAEGERPVLLFSGGKDSVVMLHLAAKAFWPAPIPFPVLHVDTGHNFPEVLEFRDRTVERLHIRLEVASVQDYLDDGRLTERPDGTRNQLQTVPLLDAITEGRHDVVYGGARRDEEKARAKERIISLRDEFGQWDPRNQPLQHTPPPRGARAGVPAVQLDRAGHLVLHHRAGHRAALPLLRPRAGRGEPGRHVAGRG